MSEPAGTGHAADPTGHPATDPVTDPADPAGDPCRRVVATAADGARLEMTPHGGQVAAWTPSRGGPSRLWTSPLARCGPGAAVRGGVPVVFPQFAGRGPLPKHGIARDRTWRLAPQRARTAAARLVAVLEDDAATRRTWPHAFRLTVVAQALGDRLDVSLTVQNTGTRPWSFTAALHAYLATGDAATTRVLGLGGLPAEDNAAGGAPVVLPPDPLSALGPRDVAVPGVTAPVVLDDPAYGRLTVEADGFTDRVLWNPGPAHGLDDVPPHGAAGFVCVEPAVLAPVGLGPGEEWTGALRLHAEPPAGGPSGR